MTDYIASSKCIQPVLTSGNYGMSQNRNSDESKEYIFVKLTDSAYRAIEEYQCNEHANRLGNGQCAKIQVVGNSGVIHFPTPDSAEGRKFGFAIDDVEGSLECIQQTQDELDVLGSLPLRMRIHANDDVYDITREKMAIAEETEKSKCIREIKPSQTEIGRKVKRSGGGHGNHGYQRDIGSSGSNHATSSNSNFLSNSNSNRSKLVTLSSNSTPLNGAIPANNSNSYSSKQMTSSRSPNPTLLGGSTTTASSSSNNRYNGQHNTINHCSNNSSSSSINNQTSSALPSLTTASSLSSALTAGLHQTTHSSSCSNGYSSASSGSPPEGSTKTARPNLGGGVKSVRPFVSGQGGSKSTAAGGNNKLPDITKRKLRERLIHLLALKPFKKPELYSRLANEGMRDKDRLTISTTLKDIATLSRDNTYNLKRPMWNDVNENWPFYTEQEVQQLKRRKPQNLTPPLSSDAGSSTSGHSPTSTHTGSPPPLVVNGLKRGSLEHDPYEDGGMCGAQAKKQRISHFKKDAQTLLTTGNGIAGSSNARLSYGGSGNYGQQQQNSSGRNSATPYSPLGNHLDHDNNTDLSYSVLDNADDFMPHVEQQCGSFSSGSGNNNNSTITRRNATVNNIKEKRSAASFTQQQQERTSNKELMIKKKSSVSPTPYGVSFVPEKSSSSRGSSVNNYQRQSPSNNSYPQQQQHYKTSNSVIFSPKEQMQASSTDDVRSVNINNSSNRYNIQQQQMQQKNCRTSVAPSQSRTPTPPSVQQQHYQQPPHHASSNQTQQSQLQQSQYQSPPQQPHQTSPTQQIAAAVSSYATATSSQSSQKQYDFSNYTPITSIEQRRHYKTEFESDYDEYRKLLARVEGVSMRFRGLAERLENASKGCPDYYNIKQQIVSEYERIRNEEELQREKQRFDYLHEKLAHIKQLVMDYDKTLTSATAVQQQQLMLQQQQQQQQQHQQQLQKQQHQQLSPVIITDSCATQAMIEMLAPQKNNTLSRNSRLSPVVGDNSPHYQQQHYHSAETIHQSQQQLPAQASPADTDTDDSSDSNDDDDNSNDDADSHDDDEADDDDVDNGDNEPY